MIRSFVRLAIIGVVWIVSGCGASATPVATETAVPTAVEAQPTGGSLDDFLTDPILPPATPTAIPATEEPVAESAVGASSEPVRTQPEEPASVDSPADEQGDDSTEEGPVGEDAPGSSEQISVLPSTVPAAGVHSIEVTGSGYTPGADVLVVTCVIPGEPILRSASAEVVNTRLAGLDAVEDCAIDEGVRAIADGQGGFSAPLSGSIQANSMVYAADLAAGQGAYVLVPITG